MPISGGLVSLLAVAAVAEAVAVAAAAVAAAAALQVKHLRAPPFEHLLYTSAYENRFHSDEKNSRTRVRLEVSGSSVPFSVGPESESDLNRSLYGKGLLFVEHPERQRFPSCY